MWHTPDDITEGVATSSLRLSIDLYVPVTTCSYGCSGIKIYDTEVRDEGSGWPRDKNRVTYGTTSDSNPWRGMSCDLNTIVLWTIQVIQAIPDVVTTKLWISDIFKGGPLSHVPPLARKKLIFAIGKYRKTRFGLLLCWNIIGQTSTNAPFMKFSIRHCCVFMFTLIPDIVRHVHINMHNWYTTNTTKLRCQWWSKQMCNLIKTKQGAEVKTDCSNCRVLEEYGTKQNLENTKCNQQFKRLFSDKFNWAEIEAIVTKQNWLSWEWEPEIDQTPATCTHFESLSSCMQDLEARSWSWASSFLTSNIPIHPYQLFHFQLLDLEQTPPLNNMKYSRVCCLGCVTLLWHPRLHPRFVGCE